MFDGLLKMGGPVPVYACKHALVCVRARVCVCARACVCVDHSQQRNHEHNKQNN